MSLPAVLIVEDDDAIRTLLVAALRREPVSTHTASDGLAALERLAAHDYAVILLDLMMPRVDGFEFLERMDAVRPGVNPVIIVMTAFDAAPLRKLATQRVHAVVHKPFDVERVVEMVRDCALLHASTASAAKSAREAVRVPADRRAEAADLDRPS
jgi:CheY-like chemotaxis protein